MPNGGVRSEKSKKRKRKKIERAIEKNNLIAEKRKKKPVFTPRWF